MKAIIKLPLVLLTFSFSLKADISFSDLQDLTNKIYITETRIINTFELSKHLEILKKERGLVSAEEINDAIHYTNAYYLSMEMALEPPATALPKLIALFENEDLNKEMIKLPNYPMDIPLKIWAYNAAKCKMGTSFMPNFPSYRYSESIIFNWIPSDVSYATTTLHFYYSGRKYLRYLWYAWYDCWKKETNRQNPRSEIIKRLIDEITLPFGYNIFQFVAEALENGDKTLQPLVETLDPSSGYAKYFCFVPNPRYKIANDSSFYLSKPKNFEDSESFLKWWKDNKYKYDIPEANKKLSDLKSVLRDNNNSPNADIAFKKIMEIDEALIKFCSKKNCDNTNCWYYKLVEEK